MRMWKVDPRVLCREHLLAEHKEMHMFAGSIDHGKNLDGFIRNGIVEIDKVKQRHDELALELEVRGYAHKSPLPYVQPYETKDVGHINVEASLKTLRDRCANCKEKQQESMEKP